MAKERKPYDKAHGRDYESDYKKFQKSKKRKRYRAQLNKYNRETGVYGNGDGKDAAHHDGKITRYESEHQNRGTIEKSRRKGSKRRRHRTNR